MKSIVIPFLLLSLTTFSQNNWLEFTPMKLGFGIQSWEVSPLINNFRYSNYDDVDFNNSTNQSISENNKVSYTRIPVEFEAFGEHIYFSSTVAGLIAVLQDANGFKYFGDDDLIAAKRIELLDMKLGTGGWIKDRVGLYAGMQYLYATMMVGNPDQLILGGNQRGFNSLLVTNLNRVSLRAQFLYDWVRNSKKASKGNATTFDFQAFFALTENNSIGVWAGLKLKSITSTGPQGKPTEDWKNEGIQNVGVEDFSYNLPDISGEILYIRGGVYFNMTANAD